MQTDNQVPETIYEPWLFKNSLILPTFPAYRLPAADKWPGRLVIEAMTGGATLASGGRLLLSNGADWVAVVTW